MNSTNEPAIVIERATTPRGDIQLQRRGDYYEVISNGTFLMATYNGESERLLVRSALEQVPSTRSILIGGLGVGFSLEEALKDPSVEQVTVVEIDPYIIQWNSTILAPISDHALSDPRTRLVHADLIEWLQHTDDTFDLICLDIDNGPDWKVFEQNSSLYDQVGLDMLTRCLNPKGCITFWSATPSPDFEYALKRRFESVKVLTVAQAHGDPDYIFLIKL